MRKYFPRLAHVLLLLAPAGLALGCYVWADLHYRAARRALARWAFAEAQPHLAATLRVWFWDAQLHLLAGQTARRAGDYDAAESYLLTSRELGGSPDAIDLEHHLLRAQRGELPRVERYLVEHLLQGGPDTALVAEVLTPQYLQTYQLIRARECADRWVEHEPDRAEAWLWRARVFERLRNRQETLDSYARVVQLDPENDSMRLGYAGLLTEGHRPEEALAQFEYVRRRQGDTAMVLAGLARCRHAMGEPDEARRLLETLLAREPENGPALGERGLLALQTESAAVALTWFQRAAKVMPFEKNVLYGLYLSLERLGRPEEAARVKARLDRIEEDLGRLGDLTHAIARQPHDPALRCEAGQIMLRNGQEAEGLRWLESALQEDPTHPATHAALAAYYESKGDSARAAEHRHLALAASPAPPRIGP